VAWTALSFRDAQRYESDATLWAPEVAHQPACREGHFFLGEVARQAERWDLAAWHYERAAHTVPGYVAYADETAALENLGAVRMVQKRWSDARAAWERALGDTPDRERQRRLRHNLAFLALRSGDPAAAVRLLEAARGTKPLLPASLLLEAKALHDLGRDDEAASVVGELEAARTALRAASLP
jgi:Tfp pilus assembly protein PilF